MFTHTSDLPVPDADLLQQIVWPVISGLVHDLRQPLSVIDACADYLNLVLPPSDDRARQQLQLLQQQVGEANRMLHEALLKLHYTDAPSGLPEAAANSRPLTNSVSAAVTY